MFGRGTRRRAPHDDPAEQPPGDAADYADDDTPLVLPRPESVHLADTLPPEAFTRESVETAPPVRWRFVVQPWPLIGVALLVAVLAAAALGLLDQLPAEVMANWPLGVAGLGVILLLVGLVTARPAGTLLGPVLAAVGAFALLPEPFAGSGLAGLVGLVIVALGVGILLRGVTMVRT